MENPLQSPSHLVPTRLFDSDEEQAKDEDVMKENRKKVEIFDVSHLLESPVSDCNTERVKDPAISELEVSRCVVESPAKIVCHKRTRKNLMSTQNIPNALVEVASSQVKASVSAKVKTNMKAGSGSENTNFIKPNKEMEQKLNKSMPKPRKKGRVIPSRYMQYAQNFRSRTTVKKEVKSIPDISITNASSASSDDVSVLSGGGGGGGGGGEASCSQSGKNTCEESIYSFSRRTTNNGNNNNNNNNNNIRVTDSKQTSTPNKDDLPLPYSDASTIIQDVSTYPDILKPQCRRDIFTDVRTDKFPSNLSDKVKSLPLNQTEVDILYNDYIQTLYLDKMMMNSMQHREEEAAAQIQDFHDLVQGDYEAAVDLKLELQRLGHIKMVNQYGNLQKSSLSRIEDTLKEMAPKHHRLASVLDTVPHQIATEGIYIPNDESFTDEIVASFLETEKLVGNIQAETECKMPTLRSYSSQLEHLVNTVCTEKREIEQNKELLAAMESLTIQQISTQFQHSPIDANLESESGR